MFAEAVVKREVVFSNLHRLTNELMSKAQEFALAEERVEIVVLDQVRMTC